MNPKNLVSVILPQSMKNVAVYSGAMVHTRAILVKRERLAHLGLCQSRAALSLREFHTARRYAR